MATGLERGERLGIAEARRRQSFVSWSS
jgi:hypothetical protein